MPGLAGRMRGLMRRLLIPAAVAASLLWVAVLGENWRAGATSSPLPPSPDVLLITVDTLRADALGFSGNRAAATPVLDRLAAGGRVFTFAHSQSVVTLPSHVNILTGLYPFQHGVRDNSGFVVPASAMSLAGLLRQAGYSTAAFVAAFPLDSRFGLNRGFDVYDDHYALGSRPDQFLMAERRGDAVVLPALSWWNAQRGKRRFLWVHLYDPHSPYSPPEPFATRFRANPYLGEVAAADSFLLPILEPILAGKEPPALVVFTADHGEALGEHGELTHGLFAYEGTLHVPLVLWGAAITPGRDPRTARHVDIVPTVLATLRLPIPSGLHGSSLLGAPAAPLSPAASYFESLSTCLNRGWAPLRGVLRERMKFIDLPLPELYDLAADPGETHNLLTTERRQARDLANLLPAESVWPPAAGKSSEEEIARLRSLGYLSGKAPAKVKYGADDDPKNLIALDHQLEDLVAAHNRRDYPEAVRVARQILVRRPGTAEAWENLALALRQMERTDEAIAALRQAMAAGIASEPVRRDLGLSLAEDGRAAEAVEVLRPLAASSDPDSVNAYAVALSDSGHHAEAESALRRQLQATPADPKTLENLGIVVLRQERPAEARDWLRRAVARNDQLPISWNTLGVALFQLNEPAAALEAWAHAVSLDPHQYDALYNIGWVAAEAGESERARAALRRFLSTAPEARFQAERAKARQLLSKLPS